MRFALTVGIIALLLVSCLAACLAKGGVYVDNFKITNDEAVVLSDDFEKGDLFGWVNHTNNDEVSLICSDATSKAPNCCLYLNRHDFPSSGACPRLLIEKPGAIEVSWMVWLPPTGEQFDNGVCMFQVYSESTKARCMFDISLSKKTDTNYSLRMSVDPASGNQDPKVRSNTYSAPALVPNKWIPMSLKMDPVERTVNGYVGTQKMLSLPYEPEEYGRIRTIQIVFTLGDGAAMSANPGKKD